MLGGQRCSPGHTSLPTLAGLGNVPLREWSSLSRPLLSLSCPWNQHSGACLCVPVPSPPPAPPASGPTVSDSPPLGPALVASALSQLDAPCWRLMPISQVTSKLPSNWNLESCHPRPPPGRIRGDTGLRHPLLCHGNRERGGFHDQLCQHRGGGRSPPGGGPRQDGLPRNSPWHLSRWAWLGGFY